MKVCIFGAGAIGGLLAARLARVPQVQLSVVARGAQLQALRARGAGLQFGAHRSYHPVHASADPAELGEQDCVFVTLKVQQFAPALDGISRLLGPDTVVIPPTTTIPYWYFHGLPGPHQGRRIDLLDPEGRLWRAIPPERVVGCVFRVAAELVEPGVAMQTGGYAKLPLGEPDGRPSERVQRLSQVMEQAGFEAPVVRNIRGWIWHKMISSLCWNPLAALTLAPWGALAAQPRVNALARRMMAEADSVASALGGAIPLTLEERMAAPASAPAHRMSMLQDLEHGRPLEFGALLASFHAMADIARVPTPTIDDVYALLALRAAAGGNKGE